MIFDTHAHYDSEAFDADRDELLGSLREQGVSAVLNCCSTYESLKTVPAICDRHPDVWFAAGLHPSELEDVGEDVFELLDAALSHPKCLAVGEIGLDYHWDASPREKQKEWFLRQLLIAKEKGLPVVVHDRESHADVLELLKKTRPEGVMHCFSGSAETAKEVVGLGLYVGLGGAMTFKNNKKADSVISAVPLSRILLETDCPYMAPEPFRGKRNYSPYIRYVAGKIAAVKGIDTDEVIRTASANGRALFRLGE